MAVMMYLYSVVSASFVIPQEWQDRLEQKCQLTISFMSFSNASLIEGGAAGLVLGAYYGVLGFYQSNYTIQPISTNIVALLFRVMVGLVLLIPYAMPLYFAWGTTNAYVATICFTLAPTIGLGNVLYCTLDTTMDWLCGSKKTKATIKEISPLTDSESGRLISPSATGYEGIPNILVLA